MNNLNYNNKSDNCSSNLYFERFMDCEGKQNLIQILVRMLSFKNSLQVFCEQLHVDNR
jgi:hypothetical protein